MRLTTRIQARRERRSERTESWELALTFAGDLYDHFLHEAIQPALRGGWTVRLTMRDGTVVDNAQLRSVTTEGDYWGVTYVRVDDKTGEPVEGATVEAVTLEHLAAVHVY